MPILGLDVSARQETVGAPSVDFWGYSDTSQYAIWILLGINSVFLSGRLYLRFKGAWRRPVKSHHKSRSKLSPSDYILILAFVSILAESISLTIANLPVIRFIDANPQLQGSNMMDPLWFGMAHADTVTYLKVFPGRASRPEQC